MDDHRESSAVLRNVRALFGAGAAGGASDEQLLERFRTRGSTPDAEAAFAVLVARHGPMVLGVCRRALRDPNDVADAFQATFLVLVRRAGSLKVERSLGRWLYGVSRRVATRAKADAARRSSRERPDGGPEPEGPGEDTERRELLEVLDEEIARLPEPFRAAIVLCDLGGLTHEAAAAQLGCPVGTVESRLSRGRKRLRERLARRGLAPTLAAAGGLGSSPLAVPEALSASTVDAAVRAAAASGPATLLQGVVRDMFMTKLKTLAVGVGALAVACGLGIVAAGRPKAESENGPAKSPSRPATAREGTPGADAAQVQPPTLAKPGDLLMINVMEAMPERPLGGERIVRRDGTISLGFYGDLKVAGLNRDQIKVKLIEHMRRWLPDEVLGLVRNDEKTGKPVEVSPADSDRVFVNDSGFDTLKPAAALEGPASIRPGDSLLIEVFHALPGRPIRGERIVRRDGTISLGFYGDLKVTGLNRDQIKVKLIEHLRKFMEDNELGLILTQEGHEDIRAQPVDSDLVYVDDSAVDTLRQWISPIVPVEDPPPVKPGDRLLVEVYEPLPGRPITGERLVRPDGTISLDFYGDLKVAGFNRHEIKVKVIELLRKSLSEEALGLVRIDKKSGRRIAVAAVDSNEVFVDETVNQYRDIIQKLPTGDADEKIEGILRAVENSRRRGKGWHSWLDSMSTERLAKHERRLADIEEKLAQVEVKLEATTRLIESMKNFEEKIDDLTQLILSQGGKKKP